MQERGIGLKRKRESKEQANTQGSKQVITSERTDTCVIAKEVANSYPNTHRRGS
jgi:hypothetical protein